MNGPLLDPGETGVIHIYGNPEIVTHAHKDAARAAEIRNGDEVIVVRRWAPYYYVRFADDWCCAIDIDYVRRKPKPEQAGNWHAVGNITGWNPQDNPFNYGQKITENTEDDDNGRKRKS